MTEVSEAEVEAAAAAICRYCNDDNQCASEFMKDCNCTGEARAALTAAAQVRAEGRKITPKFTSEHEKYYIAPLPGQVKVADPSYKMGWKWAFPSEAEPDEGPDVLGERKGEG